MNRVRASHLLARAARMGRVTQRGLCAEAQAPRPPNVDAPYPGAPHSRFVPALTQAKPVDTANILPTFRVLGGDGRLDPAIAAGAGGPPPPLEAARANVTPSRVAPEGTPYCFEDPESVRNALELLQKDECVALLEGMIRLRTLDGLCLQAHRQGRVPFYAPSTREEAAIVGTAAALVMRDEVFSQYREHGVLLYRIVQAHAARQRTAASAVALDQSKDDADIYAYLPFMRQNVGSSLDVGRARQMAMHYGSTELCFQMVSSTVATQIPHAAGAAYALKRAGESQSRIAVAFFGDGGSSEGDFHGGLNIAATMEAPVMFICRNNGFAISTPVAEQFKSDGIAGRAVGGYGIAAYRVDGNDALATFLAIRTARNFIVEKQKPALVELMTYRGGDHSTSDDSSLYRDKDALQDYPDPITRFANYLEHERGWWRSEQTEQFFDRQRRFALRALEIAEVEEKPSPDTLFDDVYSGPLPQSLQKQKATLINHINRRTA